MSLFEITCIFWTYQGAYLKDFTVHRYNILAAFIFFYCRSCDGSHRSQAGEVHLQRNDQHGDQRRQQDQAVVQHRHQKKLTSSSEQIIIFLTDQAV